MKNTVVVILLLCIIVTSTGFVSACAETNPVVTVENVSGANGDTIEVPVVLSDNRGFSNLGIEFFYDTTALKLVNVIAENTGAMLTKAKNFDVLPYNITLDSASNVMYNGTLVTLVFEVITGNGGEYPITADYYKGRDKNYTDGVNVNYDDNYAPLGLGYVSGTVTVKGTTVMVGCVSANCGEIAEVPITLENNPGFSNLGVEISYDKTALKLIDAVSCINTATFTKAQSTDTLPFNMTWDSVSDVCGDGVVAMLRFEVIAEEGATCEITVDYYKGRNGDYIDGKSVNYDEDFNPICLTYKSGFVAVTKLTPMIVLKNAESDLSAVDISLQGDISCGKIYAVSYDSDGLIVFKEYTPKQDMKIVFEENERGNSVKLMWWNSNLSPICKVLEIVQKQVMK